MDDCLKAGVPRWHVTKPTMSTQPCIPLESLNRVPPLIDWDKGETVRRNSAGVYYGGWGESMCCPQGETLQEVEESKRCIWPSWCQCHSLSLAPVNPDWFYLPGFTCLVPAHPGSPGQKWEGHKMVVIVVVMVKMSPMPGGKLRCVIPNGTWVPVVVTLDAKCYTSYL